MVEALRVSKKGHLVEVENSFMRWHLLVEVVLQPRIVLLIHLLMGSAPQAWGLGKLAEVANNLIKEVIITSGHYSRQPPWIEQKGPRKESNFKRR